MMWECPKSDVSGNRQVYSPWRITHDNSKFTHLNKSTGGCLILQHPSAHIFARECRLRSRTLRKTRRRRGRLGNNPRVWIRHSFLPNHPLQCNTGICSVGIPFNAACIHAVLFLFGEDPPNPRDKGIPDPSHVVFGWPGLHPSREREGLDLCVNSPSCSNSFYRQSRTMMGNASLDRGNFSFRRKKYIVFQRNCLSSWATEESQARDILSP